MIRVAALAFALALSLASAAPAAEEVQVTADNFEVNEEAQEAIFTGAVVVKHPTLDLTAEKVVVHYGEGGTSDMESFEATGSVRIKMGGQTATGQVAVYDLVGQTLRLSGKVRVKRGDTVLTGPDLVIDLVTNKTTFSGGGGEGNRVTGVFSAQ